MFSLINRLSGEKALGLTRQESMLLTGFSCGEAFTTAEGLGYHLTLLKDSCEGSFIKFLNKYGLTTECLPSWAQKSVLRDVSLSVIQVPRRNGIHADLEVSVYVFAGGDGGKTLTPDESRTVREVLGLPEKLVLPELVVSLSSAVNLVEVWDEGQDPYNASPRVGPALMFKSVAERRLVAIRREMEEQGIGF